MSSVGSNDGKVGVCATCGRSITHPGPDGECVHCLVGFGFLTENRESRGQSDKERVVLGPLQYAHFEVELDNNGIPAGLGAGAMAVTYRARDTILNSTVALKVISQKLAENPTARARFLREARAAAQIQHPNVARVIHYGEQDGECFYAMELVHGETLEARVQRSGVLPLNEALEIVEQAARGLAAGEACGVIHRDLKPSNLMIESDPSGQLLVKIIDYGVAKVTVGDDLTMQTQGGFIGTPAFASPEQFDETGRQQVDTRSDIYSLGTTLWYLLTGCAPFAGRSIEEIRKRKTNELPLKQLKSVRTPSRVIELLKSMLAVDPAHRPQTAVAVLNAIRRCHTRFEPAARRRRKRLILAAGAMLLTIMLAGLAMLIRESARSSSEMNRAIAVLPFQNLSPNPEDRFFAAGMQDEILTRLASLADIKVISRTSTEKYQSKVADLKTVGQQLGVGRVLEGSVQRAGDKVRVIVQLIDPRTDTHLWANTYDRLLDDSFAVETEVANAVAQQLDSKLVQKIGSDRPTENAAAYNAYLRGVGIERSQASTASSQDAAAAYAEAVQLDPNFALAWARLALIRAFLYSNGIDRSANSAITVKEAADRAITLKPDLGEAWLAQGQYRAISRDRLGAWRAYQKAEKYLPNNALVSEYMVYTECRLGRWRDAEAHFWKAVELDPRNFRLWSTTADQLFIRMRRWSEAEAAYNRALEISPNNQEAIAHKADLFLAEGRLDEASKQLALLPADSANSYVLALLAQHAIYERDFDLAISWLQKLTKDAEPGQPIDAQRAEALMLQGYCNEWAGRPDQAHATFERIIQGSAPTPGFVTAPGREIRSYLALAYAGLGEKEKALEQAQQAVADFNNDSVIKRFAEMYLAQIQTRLGDIDSAVANITHLLQVPRGVELGSLRYSPFWDPLRKDPRFQALLKNPPPVRY